ncbi:uncharacterized protein ARMOST_00238 [Armillaria ostoyae]|uniref:Uncharacterized protein n=1 Tax=Armillaria ostoyae TaxID=47428 RepID=A0A284QKI9_ARMOS|nr:uncharacterized protein ARMOST_00238 [Armillaria ostoyae]
MTTSMASSMYNGRTSPCPLKIIIVGAGVPGLSAAICLAKAGHSITAVESRSDLREIGAGIQTAPNTSLLLIRRVFVRRGYCRPEDICVSIDDDGSVLAYGSGIRSTQCSVTLSQRSRNPTAVISAFLDLDNEILVPVKSSRQLRSFVRQPACKSNLRRFKICAVNAKRIVGISIGPTTEVFHRPPCATLAQLRPSLVPAPGLNAKSMACECAICLFEYQDPVSLPCGATRLLLSMRIGPYFENNDGWIHGSMPDMQEIVSHSALVAPSLQTLASPFHRYIMPSVRRVYIDTEDMRKLKEKAQALEAQVHQLKKDKKRVVKEQNKRLEEKSEELERYKSKYQKLKETKTKTKASGTKRSSGTCSTMDAKRSRLEKSSGFSSPKRLR